MNDGESLEHVGKVLRMIPASAPAAAVMRHAERAKFANGHHGNDIMLTAQGKRDALEMGVAMKGRVSGLLHSPVPRCGQTARRIAKGSGYGIAVREWQGLRCDVYVKDFNLALGTLSRLVSEDGFYDIFIGRMSGAGKNVPYPWFHPPLTGAANLIGHLISRRQSGICVAVTHDWLVNVAASCASGIAVTRRNYAEFLDALFVWKAGATWLFYYKGETGRCSSEFECELRSALSAR